MTDSAAASQGKAYFPSLTGLRGIAAGWVVLFHLWGTAGSPVLHLPFVDNDVTTVLANGWFGVDLFFVLSGFLLGLPFLRAVLEQGPQPRLAQFWLHRARRVLPAYYVQFALLVVVFWWARGAAPVDAGRTFAYLSMEFLSWPQIGPLLNPVWWSLPVEWHFYLILPLLVWLFRRLHWASIAAIVVAWVVLFRIVCVNRLYVGSPDDVVWYTTIMHLPSRVDEFLYGMLAAWLHLRGGPAPRWRRWSFALGAGLLAWMLYELAQRGDVLLKVQMPWLLWHYSLVGLGFAAVVYAAAGEGPRLRRLFAGRVLTFLGDISYSLYLWHPPVLQAWGHFQVVERLGTTSPLLRFLLPIPCIVLVAWCSWRWIERPGLRLGRGWERARTRTPLPEGQAA